MATKGFKPFCAIYSTFLQRAFDQIVHDVCLQNLNVVFCMDRGGLSGDDGPTHHGLFDISYLRCIPNMVHLDASNEDELADMLFTALHHDGPIAIRYPRGNGPGVALKAKPALIPIGKAEVVKHGTQAVILGLGALLPMAMEAAKELEAKGFSTAVINPRSVKPLDVDTISFFARSADVVVTMEDHVLAGGFGSAVLEELSNVGIQTPVVRIGWPDAFVDHGKPDAPPRQGRHQRRQYGGENFAVSQGQARRQSDCRRGLVAEAVFLPSIMRLARRHSSLQGTKFHRGDRCAPSIRSWTPFVWPTQWNRSFDGTEVVPDEGVDILLKIPDPQNKIRLVVQREISPLFGRDGAAKLRNAARGS